MPNISNRDINLSARRLLLLSVVRPSLEYGSEVWEGNKSQASAHLLLSLSLILSPAKARNAFKELLPSIISFNHSALSNSNDTKRSLIILLHPLTTPAYHHLIKQTLGYCSKWRLKANVTKSAVIVFTKEAVEGTWKWGEHDLPTVAKYTFLGIDFASNGAWDGHIKKVLDCGRKKVNQLHSVVKLKHITPIVYSKMLPSLNIHRQMAQYHFSFGSSLTFS